jgi:hypothetical protein
VVKNYWVGITNLQFEAKNYECGIELIGKKAVGKVCLNLE